MEKIQKEHKDRLFKAIFGRDTKESKKWRLELYNALNGTDYTDPDALELNTIENALYITMHNDVSFLVDGQMTVATLNGQQPSLTSMKTKTKLFKKSANRCMII